MYAFLFIFFRDVVFKWNGDSGMQWAIFDKYFNQAQITLFGVDMPFHHYLAHLCALISLIIILVLSCLFVYKIIKLVGGLITR